MALPGVAFSFQNGGKGRPLDGNDHKTAFVLYYSATVANSAYAGIGDTTFFSLKDAETNGIVNTYTDATAATSLQTVTTAGTNGDIVTITRVDWLGNTWTLGSYTKVTGDNTVTLVATAIVAAINAQTYLTGFSATVGSSGAYTITAPKSWGIYPNTKSVTNTLSSGATMAITNAAFSGGTISNLRLWHYQISEFFRMNAKGVLYVSIKLDTSTDAIGVYNAALITNGLAVANAFSGSARQFLFYNPFRTFATSSLNSLKSLRTSLASQQTDAVMFYCGGYAGAYSAQDNLRALSDSGVSGILGQSGSGVGLELSYTQQQNVGGGGAVLGLLSSQSVSQSLGEVATGNLSDGAEWETPEFFDGTDYKSILASAETTIHDYGWIYGKKHVGKSGTYLNYGNCSVTPTDDYANVEDCRTVDKAKRNVYASIIDLLNRRNELNADGTLAQSAISAYEEACNSPLQQMVREKDLSGFLVTVDPTAIITSNGGVIPIEIKLLQPAIGKTITINLTPVAALS